MSAINVGVLKAAFDNAFGSVSRFNYDDLGSAALATQTAATPLPGALHRVTSGAATASFIMKSMLSKEANNVVIVVNDGANSINVYPAVGETMNGAANAALAIAAGATGFFIQTSTSGVKDWRAGVIT